MVYQLEKEPDSDNYAHVNKQHKKTDMKKAQNCSGFPQNKPKYLAQKIKKTKKIQQNTKIATS